MVRVGEWNFESSVDGQHQDIPVSRAVPHEHYDKNLNINDIAIITLSRDVKFNGIDWWIFFSLATCSGGLIIVYLVHFFFRSCDSHLFAVSW